MSGRIWPQVSDQGSTSAGARRRNLAATVMGVLPRLATPGGIVAYRGVGGQLIRPTRLGRPRPFRLTPSGSDVHFTAGTIPQWSPAMPLVFVTGDLFDNAHGVRAFAHGCNCQGSMG